MTFSFWLCAAILRPLLLVVAAADTACAESGWDRADGAVVLQVVRNHASLSRHGWKRYDGTLENALFSPAQHAHGCRAPITASHMDLGVRFVTDTLPVEPWARRAISYCNTEPEGTCERRCVGGCPFVGQVRHRYYGLPGFPRRRPTVTSVEVSVVKPNLQNIPIRTPEGTAIRRAFLPDGLDRLVDIDYGALERDLLAKVGKAVPRPSGKGAPR